MPLNICEIFLSLQGESTFAGLPCVFIRLSGCNLNCQWCDTPYANQESQSIVTDQILKKIDSYNCNLVEITGGEPLLQKETPALISKLVDKSYHVLLETNGSISIKDVHPDCIKIIDIKCPSSNESESFLSENLTLLSQKDEIKFVIGSQKDYEYAKSIIEIDLQKISREKIHLSPVFGQISPKDIAAWMIKDNLHARLSLQQHKLIWNPDKRGV
ncbi:MAG: radical SAM protein [Desulfobacteraceae bacterium]|nr:radical SAM protein [Desulfobacteraceae bacterium]